MLSILLTWPLIDAMDSKDCLKSTRMRFLAQLRVPGTATTLPGLFSSLPSDPSFAVLLIVFAYKCVCFVPELQYCAVGGVVICLSHWGCWDPHADLIIFVAAKAFSECQQNRCNARMTCKETWSPPFFSAYRNVCTRKEASRYIHTWVGFPR